MQFKRSVLYQDMGIGEIRDMSEDSGDEASIFGEQVESSHGTRSKNKAGGALDLTNRSKAKAVVGKDGRLGTRRGKSERTKRIETSRQRRRGRIRWEDDAGNQEWY